MADLISQNTLLKGRGKKNKRKARTEPLPSEDEQEIENNQDFDVMKTLKKKKDGKGDSEQQREMKNLENFLFGSLYSPVEFGNDGEEAVEEDKEISALFFTDRSANSKLSVYEEDEEFVRKANKDKESAERKPVWVDEEEERITVDIAKVNRLRKLRKKEDESLISGAEYVSRLRALHVKLNPSSEWAQNGPLKRKGSSDDEDSDEENGARLARGQKNDGSINDILQTTDDLVVKSRAKLLPGILEYSRLVDANAVEPSSGPVNSVQFHMNAQLFLTGGLDKKLRLFQIDGKRNPKIDTFFCDDCPIRKAAFVPDGSQVIISGRRKFFYTCDLKHPKMVQIGPLVGREEKSLEAFEVSPDSSTIAFIGNEGYILLVSSKTKELIGTLKMNGTARSLAFAEGGKHLLSSGGDGHVYHWDLRTRTCFHKDVDEGCINGTSLCTSPNGNIFASGSESGIVNIYSRKDFLGGKKKPLKTIGNLTTTVDFMKFNHDAQILAISSSMKKNSLKLVHIPSLTVYSNWPPPNRAIHCPTCVDFSPGGGFMATGTAGGNVLLYKLHHYERA